MRLEAGQHNSRHVACHRSIEAATPPAAERQLGLSRGQDGCEGRGGGSESFWILLGEDRPHAQEPGRLGQPPAAGNDAVGFWNHGEQPLLYVDHAQKRGGWEESHPGQHIRCDRVLPANLAVAQRRPPHEPARSP